MKALAFGCHSEVHLESLTCLLESTLDTIFNKSDASLPTELNMDIANNIIAEVFQAVNSHANDNLPRGNFMARAVSADLNTNLAWNLPVTSDSLGNY